MPKWLLVGMSVVIITGIGAFVLSARHERLYRGVPQAKVEAPPPQAYGLNHPLLDDLEDADRQGAVEWIRHRADQCYRHCHFLNGTMQGVTRFGCVCKNNANGSSKSFPDHPLELPYSTM